MSTKATTTEPGPLDTAKLGIALAVLIGALVAFYYYAEASRLLRIGGILAAVAVALGIASQTERGRNVIGFVRDAQIEVRKVVWPTRQETVQTTLVVMIVVVVFALLLWVLDLMLGGLVRMVIGRGA
jgi:preprotein translocase subunit SecE